MEVPALSRKLRFFIDHGRFRDWDDLAMMFDRKASTIQWWGHGDDERRPGTLPDSHVDVFIDLVSQQFPHLASRQECEEFAGMPFTDWQMQLQTQNSVSLNQLVQAEAERIPARLILKPAPNAGLIETEEEQPQPTPKLAVKLGQWFRLELKPDRSDGHFTILQHATTDWGVVPHQLNTKTSVLSLPGNREDGSPNHMRERRHDGHHRFIVLQTRATPPAELSSHLKDGLALDGTMLRRLASFYDELPKSHRRLFMLTLHVTK